MVELELPFRHLLRKRAGAVQYCCLRLSVSVLICIVFLEGVLPGEVEMPALFLRLRNNSD